MKGELQRRINLTSHQQQRAQQETKQNIPPSGITIAFVAKTVFIVLLLFY
jgi:hypothetical protein